MKQPRKYNHTHQGKRADLGDKFFRSSYEANYARFLNLLKDNGEIKDWEFETMEFEFPIKRGNRFYKVDFKVIYFDEQETVIDLPISGKQIIEKNRFEIHEIKGYMDDQSRIKLGRMAKFYPGIKIRVIDKKWFTDNRKSIKPLIKNWE